MEKLFVNVEKKRRDKDGSRREWEARIWKARKEKGRERMRKEMRKRGPKAKEDGKNEKESEKEGIYARKCK